MRRIFFIISMTYIAAIFLLAGSSVVSDLAPFNPCSLLHIPLYGILTALLIFSFVPIKFNITNKHNGLNNPNGLNETNAYTYFRFFLPGVITLVVAIADEINQSVIPTRHTSVTDVFLDAIGIALALFIILKLSKKKKSLTIFQ